MWEGVEPVQAGGEQVPMRSVTGQVLPDPATENSCSLIRFGSHGRAQAPVKASICSHPVSSVVNWNTATQIWFCANAVTGRLRRPVSLALRMRSSQRGPTSVLQLQVRKLPAGGDGG